MRHWRLVRCDAEDLDEHASCLASGPEETTVAELIRVCTTRWQIEEGFAPAKGEVGLDPEEVRTSEAWHRHATLCLLAHASMVVLRQAAQQEEHGEKGSRLRHDRTHGAGGAPAAPRRGRRRGAAALVQVGSEVSLQGPRLTSGRREIRGDAGFVV